MYVGRQNIKKVNRKHFTRLLSFECGEGEVRGGERRTSKLMAVVSELLSLTLLLNSHTVHFRKIILLYKNLLFLTNIP